MTRCRRLLVLASFFPLLTAAAGCGPGGPKVVKVTGTVTRDGKPVPKVVVHFRPENGRPSWGRTDDEGRYALHYDERQDGAVVGTHKVYVEFRPASMEEEVQGRGKFHKDRDAILKKYGKEETSPLQFEVKEDHQVINIELD